MRICITGASGNLGTALLERLTANAGDERHELVGVARRAASGPPYDDVDWHTVDLASPTAAADLAPAVSGADAVVHLSWDFQPSRDTAYLERAAVGGTTAVLAAAQAAGVRQFVHLSSVGVYSPGRDHGRVDESWPQGGIPTLAYTHHKVAVERLLDAHERDHPEMAIARMRPVLVVQREAASGLARYFLPAFVPTRVLGYLPVLPVDRRLVVQVVHADDVADAIVRVLERRATGPFNLAAEPPLDRDEIVRAFGARGVHVPLSLLSAVAGLGWRLRLQPVDPGWLDLAGGSPLLECGRARRELGWEPAVDARAALAELVDGIREGTGTSSPVLRPRSTVEQLSRLVRFGPMSDRRLP